MTISSKRGNQLGGDERTSKAIDGDLLRLVLSCINEPTKLSQIISISFHQITTGSEQTISGLYYDLLADLINIGIFPGNCSAVQGT